MSDSGKNTEKCLMIGAGAIGKAVGGCAFSKAGISVVFADTDAAVVSDINSRGGYDLYVSQTGYETKKESIRGVSAVMAGGSEYHEAGLTADYICTSAGEKGLDIVLPQIAEWIFQRVQSGIDGPLYVFLLENVEDCKKRAETAVLERIGHMPEWLVLEASCVERMSRVVRGDDGSFDVLCEQFFPVILPESRLKSSSIASFTEYFLLVSELDIYYKRKLYLGNLGHAVLGYYGVTRGHETVIQAMNDREVRHMLEKVLDESLGALCCLYPDAKEELSLYRDGRIDRFLNTEFDDKLLRIARSPLRKLGRNERMCAPALDCIDAGMVPEGIFGVIRYALEYYDENDPECADMRYMMDKGGAALVLRYTCGEKSGSALVRGVTGAGKNL